MMRNFFGYVSGVILGSLLLILLSFVLIICFPRDRFHSSYQSVIQVKFDKLIDTKEKKIIIIGGSSAGFGINEEMLEEATGYQVVNLGLHAGFGGLFNTEISKANIRDNDIVLLAYEYGWHEKDYFDKFGTDLVLSGIDSKLEMYRYIPFRKYPDIIGYLFTYANKKREFTGASGTYSRSSFDDSGGMLLNREGYVISDYTGQKDHYGSIQITDIEISEESIAYLKQYKKFVEDRGARLYFVAPPILEVANESESSDFARLKELAEEKTGIQYLSDPVEYIFQETYMFDTIYHCNSKGEKRRTELLIRDLSSVVEE